ncbi:MAG: hypothetical protein ABIG70_01765 [Pseudomonadota bacterium]
MTTRLAQKAYSAAKLIEDSSFKQRARKLESVDEHGFALILYWNQIEVALKLIRYGYNIQDGWPDKLDFLGTTWKPLQSLKIGNRIKYDLVLSGFNKSLWKTRNEIAHEGRNISVTDYSRYVEAALWVISELKLMIPKLERLREKKRRSDSQLAKIKNRSACAANNGMKYGKKG